MRRHLGNKMSSKNGLAARLSLFCLLTVASLWGPPVYAFDGANGSNNGDNMVPKCGGMFDLCGYSDRQNGHELIPKTFEQALLFSEGLAAVRIDGLFGYIDTAGKVVIEPRFDLAGPFHEGFAEVVVGKQAGVVAQSGDVVLQPQFGRAVPVMRDVFVVQKGKYRPARSPEFEALEPFNGMLQPRGASGLYHLDRGWLTAEAYEFAPFGGWNADLIWAQDLSSKPQRYGLMRADGKWQVEPAFDAVQSLNDDRAVVFVDVGERENRRRFWGAVDPAGRLVIPLQYDWLSYWQQNYAVVRQNGQEGFLDKGGDLLGGRLFEKVGRDLQGKPSKVKLNGKWLGISPDGNLIEAPVEKPFVSRASTNKFTQTKSTECWGGVSIVSKQGLWGLEGPDGRVLVEPSFKAISCFRQGVAWVPDDDKHAWCPIGPDGRTRNKPDCRVTYHPALPSHHRPEKLDPDPFRSSVLWMQAYLKHAMEPTFQPPRFVGDGVQGKGSISASCREIIWCD